MLTQSLHAFLFKSVNGLCHPIEYSKSLFLNRYGRTKLAVEVSDNDIKEIILKSARSVVPRSMRSVA